MLDRKNNFDLIRLFLAFSVLLYHSSVLSNSPGLAFLHQKIDFSYGVRGFFVVSGFLIFYSYERSRSLPVFFQKRVRRIYPAYAFVVVACALLGAFFSLLSPGDYFSSRELYKYLAFNLSFLNFLAPALPGVFTGNELSAVNGALWTIKVEVMFYALVPFIAWFLRRTSFLYGSIGIYLLSVAYFVLLTKTGNDTGREIYHTLAKQLPGQMSYFMTGAMLYYYLGLFRKRAYAYMAVAVIGYVVSRKSGLPLIEPACLGVMVIGAGCAIPWMGNFGKYGDMSYGTYIFHYPVIQAVTALGLFAFNPLAGLLTTAALVFISAFISWRYIEKPALMRTSHYVEAEKAEAQPEGNTGS